jgi:predicted metalloprotease with PDZ domain
MKKKTIQIQVREDLAEQFEALPEDKKYKIGVLLTLYLKDWMNPKRSLEEVMDSMSEYAQAQGLTPEILEAILKDE